MTRTLNVELLLRAVHAIEHGKMDHNELARELGVNRTTLLRLRTYARDVLGFEMARAKGVRILYVSRWGAFDPDAARKRAAAIVRARAPGAFRKAMIERKATP